MHFTKEKRLLCCGLFSQGIYSGTGIYIGKEVKNIISCAVDRRLSHVPQNVSF